jgi:hypothetical protein
MRVADRVHDAQDGDGHGSFAAGRWRLADLGVFPAGDGQSLLHSRDSGAAGFYRADTVALLLSCREFRTIDEHVQAYARAGAFQAHGSVLHRELLRLSKAGFLVSADRVPPRRDAGPQPAPISTIVIPTRDRPALLRRAIDGYARNCARHGRPVGFVVSDDSAALDSRRDCRAMLAGLARDLNVDICYAGAEERAAFAVRLASSWDIPEEVVRFGCLPARGCDITVGANRNTLLLHTVGEPIFSADDDTICRVAVPPGHADGHALDQGEDPLQTWFFGSRPEAFEAVRYTEEDFLLQHDRYLGQEPWPMLAGADAAVLRTAEPALLRRLVAGTGRIRITANGVVGDCGWDNPDFYLFAGGATFDRLTGSPAGFGTARATREMIQAVTLTTITTRPDPRFAMCIGLDNADLLPPFPPVGRGEEVAFGAILCRCFGDVYGAQLPLVLRHDPAGRKQFAASGSFSISLGSWLPACIGRFDPGFARPPAERLRRLGSYLTDLGALPGPAFDEFVRLGLWASMSTLISNLEDRLASGDPVPACWAADARQFIAKARRSALVPAEQLYAATGGREALQRLLTQFGQLMIWWPVIVESAGELRAAGHRLAQPVLT